MASLSWLKEIGALFVEDHFKPLDEPEEVLANPQPVPRPSSIRLLTQNIWGLPHAFDQRRRMAGLCELLSSGQYDIICFQEVARVHDVARFVRAARSAGIQHYHFFTQGVGFPIWKHLRGSGLLIFSRFPILSVHYNPYTINGKPHKFQHCDYMGAKGVALARIDTGSTILDVYCSHIHARYVPTDMDDEYVAHRSLQLYELSKFVSATRCRLPGSASVLVGDLNTWHGNLGLEMLQCVTGMHDAYAITHPDTYLDAATHNVLDNVYRETDRPPRHIDHVLFIDATPGEQGYNCFVRHNQGRVLEGTATHWRVNSSAIIHEKLDDGTSLSDHCGVSVTLRKCDHPSPPAAVATASDGLGACGGVESWAEAASTPRKSESEFQAALTRVIRDVDVGLSFVRARRRWHLRRCAAYLVLFLIAAFVDAPNSNVWASVCAYVITSAMWARLLAYGGMLVLAVAATVEFVLLTYSTKSEEMALMEGRTQLEYDLASGRTHRRKLWSSAGPEQQHQPQSAAKLRMRRNR